MRTFPGHAAKHSLHGITVVVEAEGEELFVGRCDDIDAEGVHLKDADRYPPAPGAGEVPPPPGVSREQFLDRARRFGVWPHHRTLTVPAARVKSVVRLVEI